MFVHIFLYSFCQYAAIQYASKNKTDFFDIPDSDFVCFGWKFCYNLLLKTFVSSKNLNLLNWALN